MYATSIIGILMIFTTYTPGQMFNGNITTYANNSIQRYVPYTNVWYMLDNYCELVSDPNVVDIKFVSETKFAYSLNIFYMSVFGRVITNIFFGIATILNILKICFVQKNWANSNILLVSLFFLSLTNAFFNIYATNFFSRFMYPNVNHGHIIGSGGFGCEFLNTETFVECFCLVNSQKRTTYLMIQAHEQCTPETNPYAIGFILCMSGYAIFSIGLLVRFVCQYRDNLYQIELKPLQSD